MDLPNIGGVSGIVAGAVVIMYAVYKVLKNSHCRSKCWGRDQLDIHIDLEAPHSPIERLTALGA